MDICHSTHLIYLKVNTDDHKTVGRLFAHQVRVVRQILLTVVPTPQHSWCTHKHIQHHATFRKGSWICVINIGTQLPSSAHDEKTDGKLTSYWMLSVFCLFHFYSSFSSDYFWTLFLLSAKLLTIFNWGVIKSLHIS